MRPRAALAAAVLATLVVAGCEEPGSAPAGPVGAPQVVCQGVPRAACQQGADTGAQGPGGARGTIARIVVRCKLPVCTDASGEADITVFYVDGRQETSGYGWASAPAVPVQVDPPIPVTFEPECVGVPLQQCIEMATTEPGGTGVDATVGAITVRCSAICTAASGQGQTTYDFVDGRASVTIDWTYGNGG